MLEAPIAHAAAPRPGLRWLAVALLAVVAYVHLSLLVDILGLTSRLGVLFALDVLGFGAAIAGVLGRRRWLGWALGIAVAGISAVARLGATASPSMRALVMGSGIHATPSSALPTFAGVTTLGDVSVAVELAFVAVALYALWGARGRRRV